MSSSKKIASIDSIQDDASEAIMKPVRPLRPLRNVRVKPAAPILPQIISRINDLQGKYYENIRNEFDAVAKYFKDDKEMITMFWLTHMSYNLTDFKHRYLLRRLIECVGYHQPLVISLLNQIDDGLILSQLGTTRFHRDGKVFYRIRVGEESE
jgi:hypothetical protein